MNKLERTYQQSLPLLNHLVNSFVRRKGLSNVWAYCGGPDELRSLANETFLVAAMSYRRRKGKFSTWLYTKVSKALLGLYRKGKRRAKYHSDYDVRYWRVEDRYFSLEDFMGGLGRDSAFAVGRLFAGDPSWNDRFFVRDCLRLELHSLGWSQGRIRRAFKGVREAILS